MHTKKPSDSHPAVAFSQFCSCSELLHAVSSGAIGNSNGVDSVNDLDRIGINSSLSLSGLVTTRSERNSCNSHEHKY